MLVKLQKLIKKKGVSYVAFNMGYRSETTILKWVRDGVIPKLAEEKVKAFLKEETNGRA